MLKHAKHNESYKNPDQKQQKNQPKLVFSNAQLRTAYAIALTLAFRRLLVRAILFLEKMPLFTELSICG